jgi:hypothetical protein
MAKPSFNDLYTQLLQNPQFNTELRKLSEKLINSNSNTKFYIIKSSNENDIYSVGNPQQSAQSSVPSFSSNFKGF